MELISLQKLPAPLLAWYDANRRVLPWREEVSPYRTWVSEIMLQQTRVQAVLPYFQRFMDAAPDVAALAAMPEQQLMRLWQGLGYYSRARNLKRAAQTVVQDFGGEFPDSYDDLRRLAGIGDYTAGAILSIAFGQAVPAVDGNVLRVAARLTGDSRNVLDSKVRAAFRQAMADTMPHDRPGDFNQALMDLGAAVCLPNGKPLCDRCPAADFCTAKRDGKQALLPVREKKKEKREVRLTLFIMKKEDGTAAHGTAGGAVGVPPRGGGAGRGGRRRAAGGVARDTAAVGADSPRQARIHPSPLAHDRLPADGGGGGGAGLAVGRCSGAAAAGHPLGLSGIYGGAGRQYRRGMR